jgi:hypothetical protein
LIAVSTLWRRVPRWRLLGIFVGIAFVVGWWVPPITSYAPEDNLTYGAFVRLHQKAVTELERRYPKATVLTAWPGSDEISHPYLGYSTTAHKVVRIENFSFEQLMLAQQSGEYDVALLFSTKTASSRLRWNWWQSVNKRFFDLHDDVSATAAAQVLGGRVVYQEIENGQWVAIVEIDRARNAD